MGYTADDKARFARAWADEPDAFKAALTVFGDAGRALFIAQTWAGDEEIKALRDEAAENSLDDDGHVISKRGVAQILLEIARAPLVDAKDRITALSTINKMYGFEKESPQQVVNVDNRRVMLVPHYDSDEAVFEALAAQQAKLVSDAKH